MQVDAVVGNPPYIRQEAIDRIDKSNYAELFRREWPGQTKLSGRSDIYVHFFTHAASLLEPGGYLGFVTSVGWLDTEYGFRLQEFFLRNFRIVAVIESQVEKWFEDARVTTAVTILQREPDRAKREANPVRFIQLRAPLAEIYTQALDRPLSDEGEAARQSDMDAVRDLIEEIDANETTDYWRVTIRTQRELWEGDAPPPQTPSPPGIVGMILERDAHEYDTEPPEFPGGKWGQHVRGPNSWFELLERARTRMAPLHELALVRFGFKTGADRFFCVRDVTQRHLDDIRDPRAFLNRWGISRKDTRRVRIVRDGMGVEHLVERRYLEPELHSLMEVRRAVVRKGDVGRMVVNASVSRARLRRTHFADYVAYAEGQGWHTGSTIASRARTRPWYDLGLRPKSERADMFWPMAQQYRHVVPVNEDSLPANHNLFDLWAVDSGQTNLLWAVLNSTVTVLSKHQFGRAAGIEGNLKTEVVDVNMMLVPDIRTASPEAAARAVDACERMSRRNAMRFLYEEFMLDDRRDLDDAVLEILGFEDADERAALRDRLYRDVTDLQKAIRERELIAQRDRAKASRRGELTPREVADELWAEHRSELNLLQFPDDFVPRPNQGDVFDLPQGEVEVGIALIDVGGLLKAGTVRVGGGDGEVMDAGSVSRARFLEALSLCHRSGPVRLPSDEICDDAVSAFDQYRIELRGRCVELAQQRTRDQRRQQTIVAALLRKALQWRRP